MDNLHLSIYSDTKLNINSSLILSDEVNELHKITTKAHHKNEKFASFKSLFNQFFFLTLFEIFPDCANFRYTPIYVYREKENSLSVVVFFYIYRYIVKNDALREQSHKIYISKR